LSERVPLRIIAADDVRTNRELIRRLAAYFGYKAEVVENGAEALAALSQCSFDLILLDVQMPVMDGLETAREIVRLQPDPKRRPKMVAITADSMAGDRKACLAAGMDDCLDKPISPRAFEACIMRLFTGAASAQPAALLPVSLAKPVTLPLVDLLHLETAISGLSGAKLVAIQRRMHCAVIRDFETIWPRIIKAVSRQDQSQLAEALHALKGCFSAIGWNRIADRCAEALQRTHAQQFAEWSTFPDELQQLYAASTAEMTRHLASIEAPEGAVPASNDGAKTNR
jgi:CheY-like chemotaxis protein